MKTPCTFIPDEDSCQATPINRCTYCGSHSEKGCSKETADRGMVTALACGNLSKEDIPLAEKLKAEGVKPFGY